jgi:Fe-S cluster biogenesis protein NfuA
MAISPDDIQIMGEPQNDPNVCKFTVNHSVYAGGSVSCSSPEEAAGSPLLEELLAIEGISRVLVYGDTIVLAKSTDREWPALGKEIGTAIRNTLSADVPPISEEIRKRQPSEVELRARLEELFESQINPAIAGHGGHVEIVDVKGTSLYINFSGGCQGCAASSVTLKQGIEQIVSQNVPEISEIVDMTDHATGVNPYYS